MSRPVDISPATAIRKLVRHAGERTAVVYEGRSIAYGELVESSARLAAVLAGGVGPGDRVAYLGRNSPAFLATYLASVWVGGIFVPVNHRLQAEEVDEIVADCRPHTAVVEAGHVELVDALAGRDVFERRLLVDDDPAVPAPGAPPGWEALSEAAACRGATAEPVPRYEDDVAALFYTSGTTGRAKGVVTTYGALFWNGANLDGAAAMSADDVNLVVGPLFHTAPLGCFTLRGLARGSTCILRRSFDADRTLADLVELGVTTSFAVPAMYSALARLPGFAAADLSRLRTAVVAGAPAPPSLIAEYADQGVLLQQAYGLTETLFATCMPAAKTLEKVGSVGAALPFTEVRIVEAGTDREVVEPGRRGEICLRGPTVTSGYWNNPDDTARAIDGDGWLHTGDVGSFDEDGFVSIVDRLKDTVIVGGDNVYPAEVERALGEHPGILDIAVVGVPDATSGERIVALVVPAEGSSPTLAEIRRFGEPRLAAYKLPTQLGIVESLPRNAMGKIERKAIRADLRADGPLSTDVPPEAPPAAVAAPDWARRLAAMPPARRERAVVDLVIFHVAEMLEHDRTHMTAEQSFHDLGLGSLAAVELSNRLTAQTGVRVATTVLFDYPTVGALARCLLDASGVTGAGGEEPSAPALVDELELALSANPLERGERAELASRLAVLVANLSASDGRDEEAAVQASVDLASDQELFHLLDLQLGACGTTGPSSTVEGR